MTRRAPRSLLWRLGLALMAAQAAAAVGLGLYGYVTIRKFHFDQTGENLRRLAPLVAARFDLLDRPIDAQDLQRLTREIGGGNVRVSVILPDGRVIADSEGSPAALDNLGHRPEVDAALRGGVGGAVRYSESSGREMIYAAQAVRPAGDPVGAPVAVVRVALPVDQVNAQLGRLVPLLGVALFLSLVATFAVILFVSRGLSRTVTGIARGAVRFAGGDFGHRLPRPGISELAMVADAFNRMAEQLEGRIAELGSRQNEQQTILESMSNGVLALDTDQRVMSMNRAAESLLGINGSTARGRLLQEVLREPSLHTCVSQAIAGRQPVADEFTIGHGRPRVVQVSAEPLRDGQGRTAGILVLLNDVTRLRRLETIRSDFAANVSHELRTPITSIKGYVETLLDGAGEDPAKAREFLQVVSRNTDRLVAIVEDLLALARLEEPETSRTLKREDAALADVFAAVATDFEPAAKVRRIRLVTDAPGDVSAPVARHLVEQAVSNLVSNAIKYTPEGTEVIMRARRLDGGEVVIEVADQGPGIPAKHLPRLFERFYRIDRARSRELGGTGLGLAIVKHIAMVHGGRAEVESAPGKGSTFRIVLPGAAAPAAP